MKGDLKARIAALEKKLAAAPPSACAPLVRKLVRLKRRFMHLPPAAGRA